METVTVDRTISAEPDRVRALIDDLEPFMQAGGFSHASVSGDHITLRQDLGLGRIELILEVTEEPGAVLAYRQQEGIFDRMSTRYELEAVPDGTRITATTEFTLGGIVGTVLDSTIVRRKRRGELNAQFDYLEAQVTDS